MPERERGAEPTGLAAKVKPTGRERLFGALRRRPGRSQVVVAVLLATVGFAGVVQIRANQVEDSYAGLREQDLIDILNGLAGTTQRTQAEIDALTRARADLQSESRRRDAAVEQAQKEVDGLNVLAGLVPVTGPGIRVTITEREGTVQIGSMLDTIEELRTVGAEAIQINGEVRVIAQTSFEEGIGGIQVGGTLVESPYVIDAIGDANTLAGAMEFALGPRQQLNDDGADIVVRQLTSLDIESVRKPEQPEYAEPAPGQ